MLGLETTFRNLAPTVKVFYPVCDQETTQLAQFAKQQNGLISVHYNMKPSFFYKSR